MGLEPKEPIEIKIDYKKVLLGMFVFALVFWAIGSIFRHYPVIGA